jgi:hypothetical protein
VHYVHRLIEGGYEVGIYGQGGYERSTVDTPEEAIEQYKFGMAWMGGCKVKPEDIPDPRIIDLGEYPIVRATSERGIVGIRWDHRMVDRAMSVALAGGPRLVVGKAYEFRLTLAEVPEGDQPFVGEGI